MPDPITGITPGQVPQVSGDPSINQQPGTPNPNPQLIGGKYKSMDEFAQSVDQGYQTLSENLSRVVNVLEQLSQPPANNNPVPPNYGYQGVPVGQGNGYDAYNRGPSEDDINPQEFILNPGAALAKRDAKLRQSITQEVTASVEQVVNNLMVVNQFKAQNADLIPHEALVQTFLRQTDGRKPTSQRLQDAAVKTREYLLRLRGGQPVNNQAPNGNNFVEQPANYAVGPQGQPIPNQQQQPNDEQELADYILERNNDFAAKFGINLGGTPPQK